jgi:predicted transcriptional regulator
MRLAEIINLVEGQILTQHMDPDAVIKGACGADLMSDVLAAVRPSTILLTGLCTPQAVRTAQMADIAAVIFLRGKLPEDQVIELADQEGIPLIGTRLSMYEACGRLYQAGLDDGYDFLRDEQ